ncbi:hypothetical protein [Acholeplasma laidlawii]|uniref:hypothetical protein n=1 Tax=Acholeplasma laidlawii TaxID=2148 RepID=UPI0021F7E93A|nr:hypothetical protein [Acholeplasma laidlawii]
MRISDVFVTKTVKKRITTRQFLIIGALITGLVSSVIIFVTFYGQYTGTFTLSMQRDAMDKGIELSEDLAFTNPRSSLNIKPMEEIGDMIAEDLDVETARNTDGQYFDTRVPYYIAYTFYLRNSGKEIVNVNYRLRIVDSYKGVEAAVAIRYIMEDLTTGIIIDNIYRKQPDNNLLINEDILSFIDGRVKKITLFMWFDGEFTSPEMLGGGIKLDLTYSITTAIGG